GTITNESIGESIGDIKVGDSFSIWEDAEIKLNQYAKFAGFSLRRKRVEADKDGVVWCRTFECSFSGKPVSNQTIQDESIGVVTQFQQNNNEEILIADLHIFNQLRIPDTFTTNIKQCLQRKVKYAYGFGKMKKALNLALDLGCEDEIINMINRFIDQKKKPINDTNNENENVQILDPVVQKRRGHPPNKRIKSATKSNSYHVNTKNSAINPSDPNLYVSEIRNQQASSTSSRIPFNAIDTNTDDQRYERKVYICKICKQKGHNARTCSKQHQ
ncbi:16495_t:CDS:2, partial [Rhizophagus irregularis]